MASWEWRRTVTNSIVLTEVAQEHGVGRDEILRGTGIDPALFAEPDGEVTAAQELALVRNLVTRFDDRPGLGIEAGLRTRLTMHGVYSLALMSSPTLLEALGVLTRYSALTTSFGRVWHEIEGAEYSLFLDDTESPRDLRAFLLERDMAAALTNWLLVMGAKPPLLRVAFAGGLSARMAPVFESIDVPLLDRADPHQLVLNLAELGVPMPLASPLTAAQFDRECAELLQRRGLHKGVAGSVREVLMRQMNGRVSQEEVAAQLNVSLRTMRRRLAEEGTSYRQLCSETYGSLAEDLLSAGLTVEDVAHRMGYSGAPAFSTAFKQWRGISPGRFAREVAAQSHRSGTLR
ncbi:AraC family transcriptional regulator [Nocardia goodfellowii]|uniref:AraC-like DNA-binding protein n=1 Tax=Nocardia goodfellowii TaxID=882446 RepID=A0ABS4QH06_9NOCA|nr:AraC family transcriptional regulator ligand-binding domain-containing protein [Nocardia goodfellowii]MBP2190388.1 AraC-like DNA-binding protein [Nocardia goodfellowii]